MTDILMNGVLCDNAYSQQFEEKQRSFHKHIIIPEIAEVIGLEESIVLQQIRYWISKCGKELLGENGLWIYNSAEEWHQQFSYWSLSTVRRVFKSLEKRGLILSKKVNAKKWNHTKI